MKLRGVILSVLLVVAAGTAETLKAQNVAPKEGERIFVRGGLAEVGVENKAGVDLLKMTPDSLYRYMGALDSLKADGIRFDKAATDEVITRMIDRTSPTGDSLSPEEEAGLVIERKRLTLNPATVRYLMNDPQFTSRYIDGGVDTLLPKLAPRDTMTKRELRRLRRADSTAYRHSAVFRDSMKLSPTIALSLALPGFSQLYNRQAWKIPVFYGAMAAGAGVWAWQNKQYKPLKRQYDDMIARPPGSTAGPEWEAYKAEVIAVQDKMRPHNSYRQLGMGFAVASYMFMLVDGTVNFPGAVDHVKKATTLSTVFPGAGQAYNGTYWKLPIVVGGAGVLIYVIEWNNRGYQRLKTAYDLLTDGDDETIDEFRGQRSAQDLSSARDNYRRNRDLCMILTGLFYVVQIIDAHATAHMKTYDVSDELAKVTFEPMMDRFYSHRAGGPVDTFGFSLGLRF